MTVHSPVEGHLKRALGLPSLVLFGLVYMVPLTVFTTYGIVTETSGGRVPLAYVVTLVTMVFTALSYARMSAAYPVAGSAYTYSQKAFGAPVGFLSGWSLLLDYLFLPMINLMLIGIYLHAQFPSVPQWAFTLAALLLVLILNVIGITVMHRVNVFVVGISVVLIVVFTALALKHLAGHPPSSPFEPFRPGDGVLPGAAVLATLVVSVAALAALFLSLDHAVVMVSFGALIAFSMVNLSVVKHYVLDQSRRAPADLLRYGVLPVAGFAMTIWLWSELSGVTFTVGLVWMAAGFVYLLGLTRFFSRKPPAMSLSEAEPEITPA